VIYPNSTPEFRILVKQDGTKEFQIRYVNMAQGYTSKWQAIAMEYENVDSNATA
jgi:hypothetical protein